jgi:hypothetical protein
MDTSGWEHRMVIEPFFKFFGTKTLGDNWDKPNSEEILAIAAELAVQPEPEK